MTEVWTPAQYHAYLAGHETPAVPTVHATTDHQKPKPSKLPRLQTKDGEETARKMLLHLPLFPPPDPSTIVCQLSIPGEPGTKARPRFNGHVYTPRQTKDAEAYFGWVVKCAYPDLVPNRSHTIGVCVAFFTKTQQRKDLDNLVKLLFDACNGVIWADDNQIVELASTVSRGNTSPRTELIVYCIGTGEDRSCETCKAPLEKQGKNSIKNRSNRFCSKSCYDAAQRQGQYVCCYTCGKRVFKKNERLRQARQFCSSKCRSMSYTKEKICRQCTQPFRLPSAQMRRRSFCSMPCRLAWHGAYRVPSQKRGVCPSCQSPSSRAGQRCQSCFFLQRFGRAPLTTAEQQAILALWYDGQSMQSIASAYKISRGAISSAIHRNASAPVMSIEEPPVSQLTLFTS